MIDITFFSTLDQFFIVGTIVLISQIIYSTIGFGSGMFAISFLALLYGRLDLFVPFFIILCFPTEMFVTFKDRNLINLKEIKKFLVIIIPFLLLGSILLDKAENVYILILLGFLIVSLSLYHIFWEEKLSLKLTHPFWVTFFGSLSGILGGLFGMAGPPIIFYYKNSSLGKRHFRVALLSIFVFMTIFRIIFYAYLRYFNQEIIVSSLVILPFAFVGLIIGNILHEYISEKIFRKITAIALFASGFLIILKNFLKLF